MGTLSGALGCYLLTGLPMPQPMSAVLGWTALAATAAFFVGERWLRPRWGGLSHRTMAGQSPYRASTITLSAPGRAPLLVRAAALTGILLGSVAVPAVAFAVESLESDGIAVSLLPPVACAVAVWVGSWLLLARAAIAVDVARTAALATIASHVALLGLATLHVVAARLGWSDRPSMAYVLVAFSFAVVALPQAALLRAAVAGLQPEHDLTTGGPRPAPP